MSLRPIVAICGTTGVGKSKLAVELALMLRDLRCHGWKGARIINADSMQVYAGMDIITNKVTESEKQGIEHLLLGFKQPGEQYVVGQWVQDAIKAIDETHRSNQIPIVVGGTSYWIQHLMFPNRLASSFETNDAAPSHLKSTHTMSVHVEKSIALLPPDLLDLFNALPQDQPSASMTAGTAFSLHKLLSILDPTIARRWHWRDTRKVLRSLSIIKDTGKRASEIINQQSEVTMKPRYRTLCFWLYAEPSVLNARLDSRVDEMIQRGLLNEVQRLRENLLLNSQTDGEAPGDIVAAPTNYTLGLYQSIGYKEFHAYITSPNPSAKSFHEAIENMKSSTRKYAKRQVSWIRNKLLPAIYAANATSPSGVAETSTYLLDATELGDKWISEVRDHAGHITQCFLQQQRLPDPLAFSNLACSMLTIDEKPTDPTVIMIAHQKRICPSCTVHKDQPVMVEEGREWELHQNTRLHRRRSKKIGSSHTSNNQSQSLQGDSCGELNNTSPM